MVGPVPQSPGHEPPPRAAPRPASPVLPVPARRRTTLAVAALLGLLLLWFGTLTAVVGAADPRPDTAATAFVPADAHRSAMQLSAGDVSAMATREHAELTGRTIVKGMSLPAYQLLDLPAGDPLWWRETISPEELLPHAQRLRTVSADGVRLHAQVWAELGLAFSPGLLELPADVAVGREWSSAGYLRGQPDVTAIQRYQNTSRAEAPSDADLAERGCLRVTSRTELTGAEPWTWEQDNLWCPGEGMVESTATQGDQPYELSTAQGTEPAAVTAEALQDNLPDTAELADWQQGVLAGVNGDGTFGELDLEATPEGHPVVAAGGAIAYREGTTHDLTVLARLDERLHWLTWWGRPSGQIMSLSTVGGVVVLTTSQRELVAYDPGGRLLWSVRLDDVALQAPVRVGNDLVVTTLGGTVGRYRASDGSTVWTTQLERGMALGAGADTETVAVVDTDHEVTALDARTGEELWSEEFGVLTEGVAVSDGAVLVSSYARMQAWQARTGDHLWQDLTLRWGEELLAGGGVAAVVEEESVRFRAVATGEVLGEVAGAVDVAREGDTWFVLTADELRAVDDTGATLAEWPLRLPAEARTIVGGAGRVWVFGRQPDDVILTGEWVGTQ